MPTVSDLINGSMRRGFLISNTVVLAAVLFPLVGEASFHLGSGAGLLYLGLLAAFNLWLFGGSGLLAARAGALAAWLHFGVLVALFAGVYLHPVRNNNVWLLAMPVVAVAVIQLRWPGVVLVCAALLGVIGWKVARGGGAGSWLALASALSQLAVAMGFTAGCTLLAMRERASRAQAERLAGELELANAALRADAERAEELATARERNRIARDIHDGLGHYLTGVAVQLQAARALLPAHPERAAAALEKAECGTQHALDDVRRSVGSLRVDGAPVDLRTRLAGLVRESGLEVVFDCAGESRALPETVEQALFRTVQEALTNVRKHSGNTKARVVLNFRVGAGVEVEIVDDGRGCPSPQLGGGYGLAGLRERLLAVGGVLTVGNGEQGGFRVRAEVAA